jgi:enoyl-CoA hydratase/carnithine racemase
LAYRVGGTQRLPRLIPTKKALEIIMTGDMIDAKEAERLGIVNKVVPRKKPEETVNEVAQKLLSKSPVFLRFAKAAVYGGLEAPLKEGIAGKACYSQPVSLQKTRKRLVKLS